MHRSQNIGILNIFSKISILISGLNFGFTLYIAFRGRSASVSRRLTSI